MQIPESLCRRTGGREIRHRVISDRSPAFCILRSTGGFDTRRWEPWNPAAARSSGDLRPSRMPCTIGLASKALIQGGGPIMPGSGAPALKVATCQDPRPSPRVNPGRSLPLLASHLPDLENAEMFSPVFAVVWAMGIPRPTDGRLELLEAVVLSRVAGHHQEHRMCQTSWLVTK